VTVTRLSGGLTPEDGSDPRTFPAIFNAAADLIEANESDINDLELKNIPTFGTAVPADGDALVYDDALGVYNPGPGGGLPSNAFAFVETVYFTSSGTFTKADYPWLRAIRVKVQGGGGGGGNVSGAESNVDACIGGGGGGGEYAEVFITDIAGLDASITVTRGGGGSGDSSGSTSLFFGYSALGGASGSGSASTSSTIVMRTGDSGSGGSGGSGAADLRIAGSDGTLGFVHRRGSTSFNQIDRKAGGQGGASALAGATDSKRSVDSFNGKLYGGGGSGAFTAGTGSSTGGSGADGIVIVDLYA
jgi:hypothetical protein